MKILLILFVVICGGFWAHKHFGLEGSSKTYVENVVPPILTSWSVEQMRREASPDLLQVIDTNAAGVKQAFASLSKLGALKSFDDLSGKTTVINSEKGRVDMAEYNANGVFENGTAGVGIKLMLVNEKWRLQELKFNAPQLPK